MSYKIGKIVAYEYTETSFMLERRDAERKYHFVTEIDDSTFSPRYLLTKSPDPFSRVLRLFSYILKHRRADTYSTSFL